MLKYEKLVKSVYPTAYLLTDKYYDNIVEYIVVFNFFILVFGPATKVMLGKMRGIKSKNK